MPDTLTPQDFYHKWRAADLKERSAAQSHFIDICRLVGEKTPAEADPHGDWYTFEAGASKVSGGEGYADVWKRGCFAWEYKGPDANLDKAYQQLLQYREALQNPPLLIVSDMATIVIRTNFTNTVRREVILTLDDLLTPEGLDQLRAVFRDPERFRAPIHREDVTQEAAQKFADLARNLRAHGEDDQEIAHFLIRLLFCLFAEDVEILPEKVFTRTVVELQRNPTTFRKYLGEMFTAMSAGGVFLLKPIPRIDGGLFEDAQTLALDNEALEILAGVCALDWGRIEPAILGALFERSLDPAKRKQLGAHYTSREDILLIVEPVLMAPLRRRWTEVQAEARALDDQRARARTPAQRDRLFDKIRTLIEGYQRELASVQVLDPACGSGNFLYVALRELLDLWLETRALYGELGGTLQQPLEGLAPHPAQLHGIEISPYAHELAQTTIWIGFLQWLRENGFGYPSDPILKPLHNVLLMDAILAWDAEGQPVEPEWTAADVIIGNPPFLGGNKVRQELGDRYVEALFALYRDRVPAFADLVCYWFEKARAQIEHGAAKRAGLLATQGIRGGVNRRVLERIKETGDIFMAWSDRPWILDGAAVHVSMVGFDDGAVKERYLDGARVKVINPDLSTAVNLVLAARLVENQDLCFYGSQQKGSFDIPAALANDLLKQQNPNDRPNSDVVKRSVNARQLLGRTDETWVVDFGVNMPLCEAALYEAPFEHIKKVVLPERVDRAETRQRELWWLHARPSPRYRDYIVAHNRYITSPAVAKYRLFAWLPATTLADHALIVFARDDDYFFGVLHARPHELWALRMGTQLEDRPRYTPTTTFETYPFPWPPGQEPQDDPRVQAIADAARDLVVKRDAWLNPPGASEDELKKRTLTNLYNQRPTWLALAHERLDAAVFAAYGWPPGLSDEEVLARLLALNLQRASAGK